ncbi:hypothetical protein [Xanthomonas euvesicatoria]|uniref:hypothetical protein n=1 Tax=Xanthomonas euvesicatoria TaxID=456327 RepID=UPI0004A419D8|nr:hypothetical protein [Xanthomonas euvesicatoria]QTK46688.1 hypothetical protein XeaCFBP3836p_15995 [Xanthomonas euvesicatoria pv. alfalfae]
MKAFCVQSIQWDTDGQHPELPVKATLQCESEDDIADALSAAYGWLVSDFVVVDEAEVGHTSESRQG